MTDRYTGDLTFDTTRKIKFVGEWEDVFYGASWEVPGIRRNVRKIQTPHGEVVVYEVWGVNALGGQYGPLRYRVPGFYKRDLTTAEYPPGDGMRVTLVPANLRHSIREEILRSEWYKKPLESEPVEFSRLKDLYTQVGSTLVELSDE